MSIDSSLISFMNRINEAYIASQTVNNLITDSNYRRLVIKNGKAAGIPLGNQCILPGYWFTVFVATYESFRHVLETIRAEKERNEISEKETFKVDVENRDEKTKTFLKQKCQLVRILETFEIELENLLCVFSIQEDRSCRTTLSKKSLQHVMNSIVSGTYEFSDSEEDMICSFFDDNFLCGYRFEAKVVVADFNKFSIDFAKHLVELSRPIVEHKKEIKEAVASMIIGEVLSK